MGCNLSRSACCSVLQVENWDHMERFWQQAVHRQALSTCLHREISFTLCMSLCIAGSTSYQPRAVLFYMLKASTSD